jgi:hypothetical protein
MVSDISGLLGITNWSSYEKLHALGQDYDGEHYVVKVDEINAPAQTNNGKIYRIQ